MGYMRPLRPAQKAKVKAVKEKRGFEATIKLARTRSAQVVGRGRVNRVSPTATAGSRRFSAAAR